MSPHVREAHMLRLRDRVLGVPQHPPLPLAPRSLRASSVFLGLHLFSVDEINQTDVRGLDEAPSPLPGNGLKEETSFKWGRSCGVRRAPLPTSPWWGPMEMLCGWEEALPTPDQAPSPGHDGD